MTLLYNILFWLFSIIGFLSLGPLIMSPMMMVSIDKTTKSPMRYFFWLIITFPFLCFGSVWFGRYIFNEINQIYGLGIMMLPFIHVVWAVMILNAETKLANSKT